MTETHLDRRTYLAGIAAAGAVGLAGCSGGAGTATGTLATKVTDQPGDIADFESCVVTIVGMWLGTAESADESDGDEAGADSNSSDSDTETDQEADNEEYYEYDEPQEADLVQLQGESTQLVDERELEVGEYEYIKLDTDGVEATLDDGSSATVEVPGNAPLTFNESFEIRADTVTSFTADFTPVKRGQAGGYILQPVPQGITVEYTSTAEEDGGDDGNSTDSPDDSSTDGSDDGTADQ